MNRTVAIVLALLVFTGVMLYDVVGFLFHHTSPTQVSLLKLSFLWVAGVFISIGIKSSPERLVGLSPLQRFMAASRFITLATIALIVVCTALVSGSITTFHIALDYLIVGTIGILTIRHIFWVNLLLQLRRTSHTSRARGILLFAIAFIIAVQWFFGAHSETTSTITAIVSVTLLVFSFFAISNISWIVALTRAQKWKVFGVCLGIFVLNSILIGCVVGSGVSDSSISLGVVYDGMEYWLLLALVFSNAYFMRVAFSLLLTLPSATIIDRQMSEKNSLSFMSRILTSVENIDELLTKVLGVVGGVTNATSTWIEVQAHEDAQPVVAALRIDETQRGLLQRQGIVASIAASAMQPVYIENIAEHPHLRPLFHTAYSFMQSLMVIPIELEQKRIGTLFVAHKNAFAFDHEQVDLVGAIAGNTSVAIQNYRLFSTLLHKERYERELFLAREIQQKLLPKNVAVPNGIDIAGYTSPALEVGGDFYDFVTLKNGNFCAIVADVSGKGMSAAMYTAELKGIVLAVASESNSPADLLRRINKAMYGSLDKQLFVTIAVAEIDQIQQKIRHARAGHNPVIRRSPVGLYTIKPKGLGVGLVSSARFDQLIEEQETEIVPGDVYVLYTDGINEAVNANNEEYGVERLHRLLQKTHNSTAEFILGEVLRDVTEYAGAVPQHDDMTLVVLCCEREIQVAYKQEHRGIGSAQTT